MEFKYHHSIAITSPVPQRSQIDYMLRWESLFEEIRFYIFKCASDIKLHLNEYISNVKLHFIISRRALAREGDYEMMSVRACVCACVS